MSIAGLVDRLLDALLNMLMTAKEHRPPLTDQEIAEKRRLKAIYQDLKKEFKSRGERLTDVKLGEIVAKAIDRDEPYTQGFIWQITSDKSSTRVPEDFALAMAKAFDFSVEKISPRFAEKLGRFNIELKNSGKKKFSFDKSNLKEIEEKTDYITIQQYTDVRGAMGKGAYLLDTEGEVIDWRVSPEWANSHLPANTGIDNLRIITGLGDSMKGLYNSGDPLIVDTGIKSVDFDAVYFFRVGDEGYVKRLQKTPAGILVISQNTDYRDWTITKDMDLEVFGRVLKVWEGKDL